MFKMVQNGNVSPVSVFSKKGQTGCLVGIEVQTQNFLFTAEIERT